MQRKEYAEWVDYVTNVSNGFKPRRLFIENYDNWTCRLVLARSLATQGCEQYEAALKLMEGILVENLTTFNENDDIAYESFIEQKILVLRDIGWLYWKTEEAAEKALSYIDECLKLIQDVEHRLIHVVRGDIWRERLQYLLKIEGEEVVLQEIKDKIESYHGIDIPRANSYLFNAYYVLADIEKKKDNHEEAINYLKKALSYFPLEDKDKKKLSQIWNQRKINIISAYSNMKNLTKMVACWAI